MLSLLLSALAFATQEHQPMTWDDAHELAEKIVAQMTLQEKTSLMLGGGWKAGVLEKWWYVGNTPAVARLGVPTGRMQDSAGGFRTYWTPLVGTVTTWPSLLAMAATFDPEIVHSFGIALGEEFAAKGANAILGPSINVHRVARNGRNFEYISGEDPYLGARLTEAYVLGVQSRGVMAVLKHWVFNSQETHRTSESSVVDSKTSWELYYPPFEAGIAAGASGVMCSYNKINGSYSCEGEPTLSADLKGSMGFRGFVQSDWGATHSTHSAAVGLDMEMPMAPDAGALPYFFGEARLAQLPTPVVDDAAQRIVAAMARMHMLYNGSSARGESGGGSNCTALGGDSYSSGSHVACCAGLIERLVQIEGHPRPQYICEAPADRCDPPAEACLVANVSIAAHAALARSAAAASIVLLKNGDGVLPLRAANGVKSIAIIGSVANGSAYDPTSDQGHGSWNTGDYYSGGGSGHVTAGAQLVTTLAGLTRRAELEGMRVLSAPTDEAAVAVPVAKSADVALIVAGSTCGEAADRANLALDHDADALISAVAATGTPTVVLLQLPGTALTPWRDHVSAAAVLFLGGQATGSAWADVIFGDASPVGKLPVVFPSAEADTIAPSPNGTIRYSEGLRTSYRNTAVTPAYPFGHGLSYSTFTMAVAGQPAACKQQELAARQAWRASLPPLPPRLCVNATVTNTGGVAAATVVQLYAEFPPVANQPAPILKGFAKTPTLAPHAAHVATFELTTRDLSYYDAAKVSWVAADSVTIHIGASSTDLCDRRHVDLRSITEATANSNE